MLRFPLVVGVVFIHAYGAEVGLSHGPIGVANTGYWVDFCQNLVSQGMARIAVPMFFLMSGYFFFSGFTLSADNCRKKIASRVHTLLIPFLFWNVLTLLLIGLAQYLPATQSFFSGKNEPIAAFGPYDYFNAIFGIDRYPISYQFWFIRDLMVMILISPAIWLILRKAPRLFLLVILTLWFLDVWPISIPSLPAFAFFYAGAYFAYTHTSLFTADRFGFPLLIFYVTALLIDTATKDYLFNDYVHNIGILFGIASMFFITKVIQRNNLFKKALLWASGCSFFVFAVHEPLLTMARKISYKVLVPSNGLTVLSSYFLIPVFVIIFSVVLYISMKSITPGFLRIISGGR